MSADSTIDSTADSKLATARFLQEQCRKITAAAREVPGIEDEPVRRLVRNTYDLGKQLMDARAKEMAGNPTPKGQGGKKK